MKRKNLSFVILCVSFVILLAVFCGCKNNKSEEETNENETEKVTENDTSRENSGESEKESETSKGEENIMYDDLVQPQKPIPASDAGASSQTVLYAKDFGVVGDGVKDDGPAISAAVNEAVKQNATLVFEKDKTYYIGTSENNSSGFSTPFALNGASNVTIDGGGSVFAMKPGLRYFVFTGCSNVKLTNCKFTLSDPVYLVGKVKSVSGMSVEYEVDQNPYLDSYDFTSVNGFSIRYNTGVQNRPHRFMGLMEKTGDRTVKVNYKSDPGCAVGDLVFLPNPGIGHCIGESVYIGSCDGAMLFENIDIMSAPSFVFAIKGNCAEMYFENVNLSPDKELNREIEMVAWRDGYHCKDNRGGLHWNKCRVDVIFDDVFNISGTLGIITDVKSNNCFSATNYEYYSMGQMHGYNCADGDVIDVYDIESGKYLGCATVRKTTNNSDGTCTIVLDYGQSISGLEKGYVVANRETCAPGSTITDCKFTGTYRFLRNLKVENTVFDVLEMWIMVEGGVEGPLPGNIDFVNCTFNGGNINIDAYNRGTSKLLRDIGSKICDIGFWGCEFNSKSRIISKTKSTYVKEDNYTEDDLFTVKNAKKATRPMHVIPTDVDMKNGVMYDFTRYTTAIGNAKTLNIANLKDETLKNKLSNIQGFYALVLMLENTTDKEQKFGFSELLPDKVPFLYDGSSYLITIDYYTENKADATFGIKSGKENKTVCDDLFAENRTGRVSFIYKSEKGSDSIYITLSANSCVYMGNISITPYSNANPSDEQLKSGHTFEWSQEVTVGTKAEAVKVSDIKDSKAKEDILNATAGFSEKVLHINGEMGEFTGFTEKAYYKSGTTYNISLYSYVRSTMEQADGGTQIYLIILDSTSGNRILAQKLFDSEGISHLELDWTVGDSGEYAITFYVGNTPKKYADIYLGDFTITVEGSNEPEAFLERSDYKKLSQSDINQAYTFDFTENNLCDMGNSKYASLSCITSKVSEAMKSAGFGDTVYYANSNFRLYSLSDIIEGGKRYKITMKVYDCKGNLASSGARGAFVLLNMSGGSQNGAEINYTVKKNSENGRILEITFDFIASSGSDTFLMYQLMQCEFFIGSMTVEVK